MDEMKVARGPGWFGIGPRLAEVVASRRRHPRPRNAGLSVAREGDLHFTANPLHRQARDHGGKGLRQKPQVRFRSSIDAGPVLLAG